MDLPPHLRAALERLIADSEADRSVTLDAIGDAIASGAVDTAQIEHIFATLEARGRTIVAPAGGNGVANLRRVLPVARTISKEQGRTAKVSEIARAAGLTDDEVRRALLLAKVMGR
jgi:hypothetical protein